uniref:Uncharacterized protein n=1 Tax=Mycena chlorophos TaxID=658473 RepID=A0ABQ0LZY7_MYCCL|nr:predicted protein [Mycena chlorophos]
MECNAHAEDFEVDPELEEGESILLIDFEPAIEIRAKGTQAQQMAEEASREKVAEAKIPEQYREFVKVFAKELFDALPE